MDYSLPGSSVHGISQARILGWVSIIVRRILYTEPPGKSGKQIATGPAVEVGGIMVRIEQVVCGETYSKFGSSERGQNAGSG